MTMEMLASHIDGIKIIKPRFKTSEFSNFSDVYSENIFSQELDINDRFIIDHQVILERGTIRGIYYQLDEDTQSYLVRCIKGITFFVFLDMRIDSDTYGEYFSMRVSDVDQLQIYACEGFAMGFVAHSDQSTVLIKTNKEWNPDNCRYIIHNDPELEIDWLIPSNEINRSDKYSEAKNFDDVEKI